MPLIVERGVSCVLFSCTRLSISTEAGLMGLIGLIFFFLFCTSTFLLVVSITLSLSSLSNFSKCPSWELPSSLISSITVEILPVHAPENDSTHKLRTFLSFSLNIGIEYTIMMLWDEVIKWIHQMMLQDYVIRWQENLTNEVTKETFEVVMHLHRRLMKRRTRFDVEDNDVKTKKRMRIE